MEKLEKYSKRTDCGLLERKEGDTDHEEDRGQKADEEGEHEALMQRRGSWIPCAADLLGDSERRDDKGRQRQRPCETSCSADGARCEAVHGAARRKSQRKSSNGKASQDCGYYEAHTASAQTTDTCRRQQICKCQCQCVQVVEEKIN